MVKLYRNKEVCNSDSYNTIVDNDAFFVNNVTAQSFNKQHLFAMEVIDKATLIDVNIGTIQTPYGVTDIDNLSTGCKVVLNFIFIMENKEKYKNIKFIDATEAGWNALEVLFQFADKDVCPLGIICEHNDGLFNCRDREYLIDDKELVQSALYL